MSHGCIRVEQRVELAAKILGGSSDRLGQALARTETQEIPVDPPVPVHILYWTAWVDEDGTLRFAPDLYELDGAQIAALESEESPESRVPEPSG